MHSSPHSSPCAPALGVIATPCMPVSSISQCASSSIASSAPGTVCCGCSGWMSAKPGSRATFSSSRGLCFIVHEPSGNRPEIDRIVLARQAGVVAHRLGLGQARAGRRGAARRNGAERVERCGVRRRRNRPRSASARPISKISGSSSSSARLPVKVGAGGAVVCAAPIVGTPAGGVERVHASTSFSAVGEGLDVLVGGRSRSRRPAGRRPAHRRPDRAGRATPRRARRDRPARAPPRAHRPAGAPRTR